MLKTESLVEYLRTSLFIYDPEEVGTEFEEKNPEDIPLSDSYLVSVLKVALSKFNPEIELDEIEPEDVYLVVLLARKEIYLYLATRSAPLYDLGIAGSSGSSNLTRNQIFEHYMALIKYIEEEYQHYVEMGGRGSGAGGGGGSGGGIGFPIATGEFLLDRKYYTNRYYTLDSRPKIRVRLLHVSDDLDVFFSWKISNYERLDKVRIFIDDKPIIDEFSEDKLALHDRKLKPVFTTTDAHKTKYRVSGLKEGKTYFIAGVINERNGHNNYHETSFEVVSTAEPEETPEEEKNSSQIEHEDAIEMADEYDKAYEDWYKE